MRLTINFRWGVAPLTVELDGPEEEVLGQVTKAIETEGIFRFTDNKGEKYVIPGKAVAYVQVPSTQHTPVGFGRM